jgi:cell division protein ZapA
MAQVVVNIAGRPYRMACEDGEEEHLVGLARTVDEKIALMRGSFGEIGDQRLIVMSAIAIADELSEVKLRLARSAEELGDARRELDDEGRRTGFWAEQVADNLDRASERIERIARILKNPAPE